MAPEPHRIPLTEPDLIGEHGKAWRCNLEAMRKKVSNPDDCTIAAWIVHAPWAHPLWHSYHLTLSSLAPTPGIREAVLYVPGASHELMVWACDPDHPLLVDDRVYWLTPAN